MKRQTASIKDSHLSPKYFLNNYCGFGLGKDAVGLRDEGDSALAFRGSRSVWR